jgi:ABC-type uncharacterized transport system substrate-binding protein
MNRRALILGIAGTAAAPLTAPAQQKAIPTVGFLSIFSPGALDREIGSFRQGLAEEHYVEGRTVAIEYRWAEGERDRALALAAELVDRRVEVIAAIGRNAADAAKSQSASIPIVFYSNGDPVEQGLVQSLARPGGNLTGTIGLAAHLNAKLLGLLRDLVPSAAAIGLLVNPVAPLARTQVIETEGAGVAAGVKLIVLSASTESELDAVFASLKGQGVGGLVIGADAFFRGQPERIVGLASRAAIPTIYNDRAYPLAGGLMSYGTTLAAVFAQVGRYVGKVLNGAKPADLPVMQPTKFELFINLKTAKQLGLTVPQILLAQADEVIE